MHDHSLLKHELIVLLPEAFSGVLPVVYPLQSTATIGTGVHFREPPPMGASRQL
jgi:hypothetical protein